MFIHDKTKLQLIADALKGKEISMSCKVCNNGEYFIKDMTIQIQPAGIMYKGEQPNESVILQCSNCGNIMLFDLKSLGLNEKMLSSGK